MNCSACGATIPAEGKFCPKCGAPAGGESAGVNPQGLAPRTADNGDVEEKLWDGGYSGKAMIGSWLLAGVVTIALVVGCVVVPPAIPVFLGIGLLIWAAITLTMLYRKMNIYYELTTQRFIHKTGILTRRTDRIEVIDIDDVTYQQGIVQRMVNVGTIKISSSDRTHPQLALIGIDDVARVADMIDNVRRAERRKRGLHIENI